MTKYYDLGILGYLFFFRNKDSELVKVREEYLKRTGLAEKYAFVINLPEHEILLLANQKEKETEGLTPQQTVKELEAQVKPMRDLLEISDYYGLVYYAINEGLECPFAFLDCYRKENFAIYLLEKNGSITLCLIIKSRSDEKSVNKWIHENILLFLYSSLTFQDMFERATFYFGRTPNSTAYTKKDSVFGLHESIYELSKKYFDLANEELTPGMLKTLEKMAGDISRMYSEMLKKISAIKECKNTMEIHLKNLKTSEIVFGKLLADFEKKLEQVNHDLGYADTFSSISSNILDSIKLKIEMFRSGESFRMQRESLKMQRAAEIIEFIIVMYYFTHLWEVYAPHTFEHLGWWKVLVAIAFSGSVTLLTDLLVDLIGAKEEFGPLKAVGIILATIVFFLSISITFLGVFT